jgi:sulfite reductase (NADPH) flavoprotein alpha-component
VLNPGHSAVYKAAHTGFTILASGSLAEAQDIALIAHLLAQASKTPVLHFYDGSIIGSQKGPLHLFDSHHIRMSVDSVKGIKGEPIQAFEKITQRLSKLLNSSYKPLEYTGSADASVVFVGIGYVATALGQAVFELVKSGENTGFLNIRMYRPWSASVFLSSIPRTTRKIVVLDEFSGSQTSLGQLVLDLEASLYGKKNAPTVVAAKFSRGLQNIHPVALNSFVLDQMHSRSNNHAVEYAPQITLPSDIITEAIFWDKKAENTTVALDHIKTDYEIAGRHFLQSYAQHLSTSVEAGQVSHLRSSNYYFSKSHLIDQANVVMCNSLSVAESYNFASSICKNGKLFINTSLSEQELLDTLPACVKHELYARNIKLFALDANLVAANYTIFYGVASEYLAEILAAVYYHLAEPVLAPCMLDAQRSRISSGNLSRNVQQSLKESILFALKNLKVISSIVVPVEFERSLPSFVSGTVPSKAMYTQVEPSSDVTLRLEPKYKALLPIIFPNAYSVVPKFRPDLENVYTVKVTENIRLTPDSYERNVFHMELDIEPGMQYDIGTALGVYAKNNASHVTTFLASHGYDPKQIVFIERPTESGVQSEIRSLEQMLIQSLDIFGKPGKKFYQYLAVQATDDGEKERIAELLKTNESFDEYVEQYTPTYADLLSEFKSVKITAEELVRVIPAMKPRLYSISSSQRAHPNSIHLLIVVVDWVSKDGVKRFGQATNYLVNSTIGDEITVTLKPSVMKLPPSLESPVIMSGLGTGMAPFRAFIQERMYWKKLGKRVGPMSLYFGSRNRANEYLYGEELEAYHAEGILTNLRLAFSRDQKEKIYIQNRIEQDVDELHKLMVTHGGSFYLCGPTWPGMIIIFNL